MRLTEPHPSIRDLQQRHQARFLAALLLVMAPLGMLMAIAISLISLQPPVIRIGTLVVAVFGVIIGVVAYYFSRTSHYRAIAKLLALGATASIYASLLIHPDPFEAESFYFLVIPVIIAKVLLGRRMMVGLMILHLGLILSLALLRPTLASIQGLADPLAYSLLTSTMLILVGKFRDRLEWDRRMSIEQSNMQLEQIVHERQQVDARLRYQADLLENVSDAIIAVDLGFVIRSWNRAAEIMYGWSSQEAIGKSLIDLTMSEYDPAQAHSILSGLLKARTWRGELPQSNRLGQTMHVQVSSNVLKDDTGAFSGLVMVIQDITERKQSAQEEDRQRRLAQALQETAALLNSSLNLNVVLDRLLMQVERVLAYDTASIMLIEDGVASISYHRNFESHGFKPADLAAIRLKVDEKESLRWMYEQRRPMLIAKTADAPWWSQEAAAIWIKSYLGAPIQIDGEVIGFINLDKAVTDGFTWEQADLLQSFADQAAVAIRNARLYNLSQSYAQSQEREVLARTADLERERSQLRAILDSMSEGVMCIMFDDPVRQIVNPALFRMTGLTADKMSWDSLRAPETDELEFLDILDEMVRTVAEKGVYHIFSPIRRGAAGQFDGQIDCSAIEDQQGNMIGMVFVFRDISKEKALAEQKARFVANASHELRTPLTNLMTRLYIFRRSPERYEEHLGILEEVSERMRRLVDDLLDYSRFERGMIPLEPMPLDLRPILDYVARSQQQEAERKHIHIFSDLSLDELHVNADSTRITQVFTNLVTNAINYTGEGGQITLRGYVDHRAADGLPVVVEVIDTGVGIPPAALADIFKPFVRAHENTRGTGLGLSISHDIVRLHNGALSVTSEVGKGSVFTVRLPKSH